MMYRPPLPCTKYTVAHQQHAHDAADGRHDAEEDGDKVAPSLHVLHEPQDVHEDDDLPGCRKGFDGVILEGFDDVNL